MNLFNAPLVAALTALLLSGCAAERAADRPSAAPGAGARQFEDDRALQHFIEASVRELKGDFAAAILEYQDALRYSRDPAIYFGMAKCYSALQKHPLAIEAGREAVRLDPDRLEYRRTLAEAFIGAYESDSAAAQYEEIVRREPSSVESWFNLARLYQGRRPLKALEVYSSMLDRFGPDWDVLLQVAELHNALGQFNQAASALGQMLEIDPGNQALKQSLAQALIRADRLDTALVILGELRRLNPDNLDYVGDVAGILLRQKDYARAAVEFDRILREDSVSIDMKLRIGELYFTQLERDSTLAPVTQEVFQRISSTHPDDWRPHWFLGAIGALSGNDSLAERSFRRVTEMASWNADAWVYLSSVFLERDQFGEVATILESALKVLPDDFRVNFFLGVAYSRLGRDDDAIRVLERARMLNPKDVNAVTQLALVYEGRGNYEATDRLYEEALALDPGDHLALNNYSYSLAERNIQLERAFTMAEQAVRAQPENQSYLDTMGWVLFRLARYQDAEVYMRRALAAGEPSAVLHEHLGDIYFMMNRPDDAMEQWNISLRLDPGNAAVRDKVVRRSL